MKTLLIVLSLALLLSGCGGSFTTEAQIRASNTGTVSSTPIQTPPPIKTPAPSTLDIATVDFKNYTFPLLQIGQPETTFTLKNGRFASKKGFPVYTYRKTYYFELTGDDKDDALTHILSENCFEGCESGNLFYLYSSVAGQAKLLWKVTTGKGAAGGLKSVNFSAREITLETFGDCSIENGVVKTNESLETKVNMKALSYTQFVFNMDRRSGVWEETKVTAPLTESVNFAQYRPQISFGKEEE